MRLSLQSSVRVASLAALATLAVACGKAEPPTPAAVDAATTAPAPLAAPTTTATGAAAPPGIAPPGAEVAPAAAPTTAEIGKPAPDFTLKDLEGKEVSLSSFKGKTVVLEWYNPDCPFVVKQHTEGPLAKMAKDVVSDKVVWLAINSGAPGKQGAGLERNKASVTEYGLAHPVLLDEDGKVGKAYKARNTPHMYVIAPDGTLVYMGAIDNAPMGKVPEAGLVNHVSDALADLAAGRPVVVPETKAYGCSVKYAD